MPVCAKCGHANPEGSQFCNRCAAPLESPSPSSHSPSVQTALDRLKTDESGLDESYEPEDDGDGDVYVRWEGWPWSTLRRTEQTYDQFLVTSIATFAAFALAMAAFVFAGQAACGILLLIVVIPVWYIQWRVGREGAMG